MRHRSERDRRLEDERDALRPPERSMLAMGLRPEAGNQAIGRFLARLATKKVQGGRKVDYAESREEALVYCRREAEANKVVWDDLEAHVQDTILGIAQKPTYDDGSPAGLEQAYSIIQSERRDADLEQKRQRRADAMARPGSDYNRIFNQIAGFPVLEDALDMMRDRYIGSEPGTINRTLGIKYARDDIALALDVWRHLNLAGLTVFTNPHGFEVGPKAANVGATLDTRGEQGNIIARWEGQTINVHIDPSD